MACSLALVSPAAAQFGPPDPVARPLLATDAGHPGSTLRVALDVTLEPGYHVNTNQPLDPYLIPTVLSVTPPEGITVEAIAYPEGHLFEQVGATSPLAVFEETFAIGVALNLSDSLAPGSYAVPATLRYQSCDNRMCYRPSTLDAEFQFEVVPADRPLTALSRDVFESIDFDADGAQAAAFVQPDTAPAAPFEGASEPAPVTDEGDVMAALDDFTVLGTTGGYLPTDDFLEFMRAAEAGETQKGMLEGRGPLAILLLVLVGGLALNLTPCVLPMVPITLAVIGAGAQSGSRLRGFLLGAAYGGAMAVVYGVLGLVVIRTASTFGTLNASPWFNVGITVLFLVLGLAMFDVLVIDFSKWQSKLSFGPSGRGSFLVSFGMGAVAALLAGACVAPVVIQVIVFSSNLYATGAVVALALPFVLGLGMALPWPFAGAGLSLMPKPGAWMVRVKQAFGVFIVGTALYYGYLSYTLFANRWVDPAQVTSGVEELIAEGWYPSLSQGLEAAREENKLVLVDLWATWCKNCLVMDQTTLQNVDVQSGLDDYVKVKFQAEDPGVSPAKEVMAHFGAVGLPAYAILRPGSESAQANASRAATPPAP